MAESVKMHFCLCERDRLTHIEIRRHIEVGGGRFEVEGGVVVSCRDKREIRLIGLRNRARRKQVDWCARDSN